MNILIIGSEGTLGRELCYTLSERGHEIYRADLQHHKYPNYQRVDIAEYRQCEQLFKDVAFDYVYLLAAEFGRHNGEHFYEKVWKTNVIGTRNILELQKIHGFKLIFTSSSEIYGELPYPVLEETLSEQVPMRQHNDYAISKYVNEQQILNAQEQFGNKVVRIRLFNAYGPGEEYHKYRSVVCLFCYRALHGIPYEIYKNYHRVFMYVGDLMPTLANVTLNFQPGEVYNIGGKEYCSVEHMHNLVKDCLEPREKMALQVSFLDEDAHNVKSKRPSIAKAVADLDHDPKTLLVDGIPKTIKWMRNYYHYPLHRVPDFKTIA